MELESALYIAAFAEQSCDIMQANAPPENERILEGAA
jgi:hypothetical protein